MCKYVQVCEIMKHVQVCVSMCKYVLVCSSVPVEKSEQGQTIVITEIKLIIQCVHARPHLYNESESMNIVSVSISRGK